MSEIISEPMKIAALPHNGTPEWRDERGIGGQYLLIEGALDNPNFIGPVGRRFGKSTTCPFLFPQEASETAGFYYAGYIAQDHAKALEMFDFCVQQWGGDPSIVGPKKTLIKRLHRDKNQNRWIELKACAEEGKPVINTGSKIFFWSGQHPHYEKIRGFMHAFHRIVVDEASLMHPNILDVIVHMLADADGYLLVIGTPDPEGIGYDWFETYWLKAQDDTEEDFQGMTFPMMANPHLSKKGIKAAQKRCLTEEKWRREGWAEFMSGRGAVFENIDAVLVLNYSDFDFVTKMKATCPVENMYSWVHADRIPSHHYIMSADWAKARDDTVFGVYDMTSMEQVALFCFRSTSYTEQLEWAQMVKDHYQAHEFHGDENNGNGVAMGDFLRREYETGIIAHKFQGNNKGAYVQRGQVIFYEARVKLIDCPIQRGQFKSYRKILPKSETGHMIVRYSHPPEGKDDFVDSFLQVSERITFGEVNERKDLPQKPRQYTADWYRMVERQIEHLQSAGENRMG